MGTLRSRLLTHVLAFLLALTPVIAGASHELAQYEPSGEAVIADALLVRPVGVVATVLGAAVLIVSLPFTIPSGSVGTAAKALVAAPAHFTFVRPIGEFDHYCPEGSYSC
jgi:hypothetical protein